MPPVGFRKRPRSESPAPSPVAKKRQTASSKPAAGKEKSKATLFETVDAPSKKHGSLEENRKFLEQLDEDDEGSSLSEAESDDFEDVPAAKRQKTSHGKRKVADDDGDDDEMDWEDAIQPASSSHATPLASKGDDDEIGDVSISLNEDGSYIEPLVSAATGKKGPSKRERQIRVQTHCLHVMSLMWHNTIRNSWLNDKEVQRILVDGLPDGLKKETQKWKQSMKDSSTASHSVKEVQKPSKGKGRRGKKSSGRDWNHAAESQSLDGMQATSALLRLLKLLAAYWRKRFTVTAPGLRKQGYKDLRRLRNDIKAWSDDKGNVEDHGERLDSINDFRKRAKDCEGSRDVGAQLFVALLRGVGMDVRLVANLQPAGFGWSKAEEADPAKPKKKTEQPPAEVESESEVEIKGSSKMSPKDVTASSKKAKKPVKAEKPTRRSSRGNKADPINLDDSESPLSDAPSEFEGEDDAVSDADDLSVIDVTPSMPKKKPHKKYDRDLAFPVYWAEVCDPLSRKYFPVDPVVLSTIASSDELLQTFEPRGKKAELSKQVICYTIAYSSDGTAKDVTIRYLKRHQLPGKTKGVRIPVERVPVYNRKGKVKKYEDYDWFRTLISMYDRPNAKRTAADDLEEQTDLKPFKPAKEEKQVEKESLQGYKQSADFVLEQHLRREEAILPGAKPVKTFTAGKGDKAVEHPVYKRSDIAVCKTVESWHKEGRAIKVGEQPMKYVPMRAVTLVRKREIEDAQRETGEKLKQGLYSQAQTDWIIPPPIENGVIPKNAFGNMDVYVPTMVPKGAVHLPLKGTAKICRKLEIDYAEACTGFEFGKQRAVPVLTGVVVARENEHIVRDAWRADQAEARRKEDTKRTAAALHWWRKMLLGLRVLERMRTEYADAGGTGEEINPFVLKARREGREGSSAAIPINADDDMGGGFVPSGDEGDEPLKERDGDEGGGFLVDDKSEGADDGGGFLVDDGMDLDAEEAPSKNYAPITPVSLQSLHKNGDAATDTADESVSEAFAKPQPAKGGSRSRPQQKARVNGTRRKTVVSDDEADSSLSEISSDIDDEVAELSNDDAADEPAPPSKRVNKARKSSPQVVISPPQKATPAERQKATLTRSPYFDHDDADGISEEDDESEAEVVKPRQTTSRTRARR